MRVLLAFAAAAGICLAADLKPGDPAPALTLKQLMQAPAGTAATWDAFKGNAVVLEFWATWCGGCRDQIPHLNALQNQFRDRPVRFLSLTDEEPGIVQRFLKDYPIAGWIGLDAGEQTFKRYGINGRPVTALVDAAGILRGVGNASRLTPAILEDLIAGKPVAFSMENTTAAKLQIMPEALYQALVRPAGPVSATGYSSGAISGTPGRSWEIWGVGFQRLLSMAYALPESRIEAPAWTSTERYDVLLAAPDLTEGRGQALLIRTLQETFQLEARKEARQSEVYVLTRRPGGEPKLRPASVTTSSRWTKPGDLTAVGVPAAALANFAGTVLGKPVFDETGLAGRFDFELKWDAGNPQSFLEAVAAQLNLELTPAKRPLDYLVVDKAVQPTPWQ